MQRFLIYLTLFCLFYSLRTTAQVRQHYFEKIGVTEGLPSGEVTDVMIDSDGFLWVTTVKGPARYDGYTFQLYSPDDTPVYIPTSSILEDSKRRIWFGTHTGLFCYDKKTDTFQHHEHAADDPYSLPADYVRMVYEDDEEHIWVGTEAGLARVDEQQEHFIKVEQLDTLIPDANKRIVLAMHQDEAGRYWVGGTVGLFLMDLKHQRFQKFLLSNRVHAITADSNDRIWFAASNGLFYWNADEQAVQQFPLPEKFAFNESILTCMVEDPFQNLWIGTEDRGLLRLDLETLEFEHFEYQPDNALGLNNNLIKALAIDKFNNLWIATYDGLNRLQLRPNFPLYQQEPGLGRPENLIHRVHADEKGGVWFSTRDRRLFHSLQLGQKAVEIADTGIAYEHHVKHFYSDSAGKVWMGTENSPNGTHVYDFEKQQLSKLQFEKGDSLNQYGAGFIEEDLSNVEYIWLGTYEGLAKVKKADLSHTKFYPKYDIPKLNTNNILHGRQTPDGKIWLHLEQYNNGHLGYFDKTTETFHLLDISTQTPTGKPEMTIRRMIRGKDPYVVWLATSLGLGRIDSRTNHFLLISTADGLKENELNGLACDSSGMIWIKSIRCITRYDAEQDSFWYFPVGPEMRELNVTSSDVAPDGRILFGGNNGLYAFYPEQVQLDTTPPRVVLTDVQISNQSQTYRKAMELVDKVRIRYEDRIVAFKFAALHFLNPEQNSYRYKLEGFDPDWTEAGNQRQAVYTNLNPGRYTFWVQAANPNGIWSTEGLSVQLIVTPPWWRTWWACVLFGAGFLGLVVYAYQFQLNRRLAEREAFRLKELDNFKNKFYTNITHEFRTPLTVIMGVVEDIQQHWAEKQLIRRNSHHLLHLVNQILDLAKIKTDSMFLNKVQSNIIAFLRYLTESFHSLAAQKNIELQLHTELEELWMDYDPEKIQQVLSNLLANAVKFTPSGGHVEVTARKSTSDTLELTVSDTGEGIAAEHLDRIFDHFYQVREHYGGTGIGLALAKELIHLMGGSITVESTVGEGTTFTISLPIMREAPREKTENHALLAEAPPGSEADPYSAVLNKEKPKLLVVEDNADVIQYFRNVLRQEYELLFAKNGQEGFEEALDIIPDIVLSDVMMPEMDGFELTRLLKSNELTSHIPVILLTAKADKASKLEGLEYGADAYLTKPFDREELLIRLRKLLELREKLQERYQSFEKISPAANQSVQQEDAFLQKLRRTVENNISDENFGIQEICDMLAISRPQLHRKLKALTNKKTTEVVNTIRLQRAKELLKTTDMTVSQVAFEVGFNTVGYFSRKFKQEFGVPPSTFKK